MYSDKSAKAASASLGDSLYGPEGSVRIWVQLLIAAISPVVLIVSLVTPRNNIYIYNSYIRTMKRWVSSCAPTVGACADELPESRISRVVHNHGSERSFGTRVAESEVGLAHPVDPRAEGDAIGSCWFANECLLVVCSRVEVIMP